MKNSKKFSLACAVISASVLGACAQNYGYGYSYSATTAYTPSYSPAPSYPSYTPAPSYSYSAPAPTVNYSYSQSTGQFSGGSGDSAVNTYGYSGTDRTIPYLGRNNPNAETVPYVGPIPAGTYQVTSCEDDAHLGANKGYLTPVDGTDTYGRDNFRIHGDNASHDASQGCVILPPSARSTICTQVSHGSSVYVHVAK